VTGTAEPAPAVARRPVAPDAYDHYLKARFHVNRRNRTRADIEESVRLFELAIERDGTFAPAHAGLASAYQELGSTSLGGLPVVETIARAAPAAERALELDPLLGEALVALASADRQAWRWAAAEAKYRRAIELDANNADALSGYGGLLIAQGRTEQGVSLARLARDVDPLNADRTVQLGWHLYQARRHDEAIQELQAVLTAEPDYSQALWFLGFALMEVSRFDEAIRALERDAAIRNRNPATLGVLTRAYGRAGRQTEARHIVEELERRERDGYVPPAVFVNAYMGVGDRSRFFAALERACREHSNIVQWLKTHPVYDDVRDDPRFADLLRRVGLS
jgi:tetratricopeptide (TPR) repeat protein